jgi:hypothetical protein
MSNQNDSFVTITTENNNNSLMETKASFHDIGICDIGNNESNNVNYLLQEYIILSQSLLEDLNKE